MTTISKLEINGIERKTDHTGDIRITRRMSAVGDMAFYLDNTDGTYDDLISAEHDPVELWLDGAQFFYGHVSKVDTVGRDDKGRWEKLAYVQASDQAEELTFQDDFERSYSVLGQKLDDVLDDVFNNGPTFYHITYVQGSCPDLEVGFHEKKEGSSLISFLQELHRDVDCVFYVNDSGAFQSKSLPGLTSSGVTLSRSNLIGELRYHRQDAMKLYNYIKLYGKNPMFDGYTEGEASSWEADGMEEHISNEATKKMVGHYSVKFDNTVHESVSPGLQLVAPVFNYDSFDLSKGPLSAWFMYEGDDAEDTRAVRVQLKDGVNTINFYSGDVSLAIYSVINQTKLVKDRWCGIEAPIGKDPTTSVNYCDQWWPTPLAGEFDWAHVTEIGFSYESKDANDVPDAIYLDGLVLPCPCIAIASAGGFSTVKQRRPFSGTRADLRSQSAVQRAADTMLLQHQSPAIESIIGDFSGDAGLRYGGLSIVADFDMDITNQNFYATQIDHVIAPYEDVGKGWAHVMRVGACVLGARAYDLGRLGSQPVAQYSIPGIGLKEK